MKYGVCFIIKIFLATLAIEFLVGTITSVFLYIFRMAIYTCNISSPLLIKSSAFSSKAPAKTTEDVVPSPTSLSTDLAVHQSTLYK